MTELIIVDGYNIIYQDSHYKEIKEKSLELARVKLIEDLANYQAYTGHKVIVVFDAAGRCSLSGAERKLSSERKGTVFGVDVIFTKKGESADSCIESLAFKANSDKTIIVATSDYSLQRIVFGKGIYRRTPSELVNDIIEIKKEWREHFKEPPRLFLEDRLDEKVREKLRKLIFSGAEKDSEK
jgi:predicted RNA-binding protein with PIN domain